MRAFTISFAGAMAGAVSLATLGAVSTVSQTGHHAPAFRLSGGSAFARKAYDGQSAFALSLTPTSAAQAGKAMTRNDAWRPLRNSDW